MQHRETNKGAVLVTGASSGIGHACAFKLDQAGYRFFAGVRKESDAKTLRQQASPLLTPVLLDVTNEALIAATVSQVAKAVDDTGLVGLVNNAGIAVPAPLEVIPLEALRRQFEVNVIGQVAVTQALLPLLRKARGQIINVGSVASRMTFPFAGALSASKSALEALNAALRMELSPWGIHVILITPSTVRTPGGDKLRERVAVEHTLAHIGRWQGQRARYRGTRKNLFDLRRCAVVHNLHVLARSQSLQADLQNAA